MFLEPDRTPYDLSFRLFGVRVRVHPLFWLGSALLGSNLIGEGVEYLLIWIAAVLFSILVHEFGHALAFRLYGVDSHITLYLVGGLTVPYSSVAGRWRRVFVSFAGPLAGFLVAAAIYYSAPYLPPNLPLLVENLLGFLLVINLYWGLINLLPVWPLDGGQIAREVCTFFSWRHGRRIALEISVAVGGLIAIYSVACATHSIDDLLLRVPRWIPRGGYWTAILFGMLAVQSFQQLQTQDWSEDHWDR